MAQKGKLFKTLTICCAALSVAAITASAVLLPGLFDKMTGTADTPTGRQLSREATINGYADVTRFGAVPDDGKDDTKAFKKAQETGISLYVPAGKYEINDTIALDNQGIKGDGTGLSFITGSSAKSLISVTGRAAILDLCLGYDEKALTKSEKQGEAAALVLDGLKSSSIVYNLSISGAGTGIYSPADGKGIDCAAFESITINNCTYKSVDIAKTTGLVLRTAEIKNDKYTIDIPVSISGIFTIEQLRFSDVKCEFPLEFNNADSAVVKSLIFENVTANGKSFIKSISSGISIQAISATGSPADFAVSCADEENRPTGGVIKSLYSDSAQAVTFEKDDKIN